MSGAEDTVSDGGRRRAARSADRLVVAMEEFLRGIGGRIHDDQNDVGDNLVDEEETTVSDEESSNAVFVDIGRTSS